MSVGICPCCGGDGVTDVNTGWRWMGTGFGDCEESWRTEDCVVCGGTGEIEEENDDAA